jgi:hypothetical protein
MHMSRPPMQPFLRLRRVPMNFTSTRPNVNDMDDEPVFVAAEVEYDPVVCHEIAAELSPYA